MHRLLATCTCSSDTCRLVCNCDYCMPTASFALASRLLSPVSSLMTMATRVTRSKTAKSAKMSDKAPGSTKISSYFEPVKTTDRKRSKPDELAASPPSKVPRTDMPITPSTPTPQSQEASPPTPQSQDASPPTPRSQDTFTPSPEQKTRMENNKLEAEAKMIAKKFGGERIGLSWMRALQSEFKKPYIQELASFVSAQRSKSTVYPPPKDVFSWTLACPIHQVKVVILGQDPYHGPRQAHGLCFSVRLGVQVPPSLRNMYQELSNDLEGFTVPSHGYLMGWASQGVLLLNACLTVRHKEPNSHAGKGWERLTDAVVHWLNDKGKNIVFMLWGSYAQKKGSFINQKKHCILKSAHPSPLSAHRGFMGCKHFSQANEYLTSMSKKPIDWNDLPTTIDVAEE